MINAVVVIVVWALVLWICSLGSGSSGELDEASAQTTIDLHRIRRQIDVAAYRSEVRAEAARVRRELDRELGRR